MTATRSAPDPDDPEVVARLRIAVGRIARQLRQSSSGGLTVSQLSALFAIERHGPVRLGDLAVIEGIAPSTLSRIVASLEEADLVNRTLDPDDRRSAWMSLSPEGARVMVELRTERTLLLARRVAALPPDARSALTAALPALEQLASDIGEPRTDGRDLAERPAPGHGERPGHGHRTSAHPGGPAGAAAAGSAAGEPVVDEPVGDRHRGR